MIPSITPQPVDDPTTIMFWDAAKRRECLLSKEEDDIQALYYKDSEGDWRFWRFATSDEIDEILAATGND